MSKREKKQETPNILIKESKNSNTGCTGGTNTVNVGKVDCKHKKWVQIQQGEAYYGTTCIDCGNRSRICDDCGKAVCCMNCQKVKKVV